MMDHDQGSAEWHEARCGKVTMSNCSLLLQSGRNKSDVWSKAALGYAMTLAGERIQNEPSPSISAPSLEWGHETEDRARAAYELEKLITTLPSGFIEKLPNIGGSPDGFTKDGDKTGIHEIKCPYTTKVHIATLWSGKIPDEHIPQIQGNIWVAEVPWCDFISYDPRVPECELFVERVFQDDEMTATIEQRAVEFEQLVTQIVKDIS